MGFEREPDGDEVGRNSLVRQLENFRSGTLVYLDELLSRFEILRRHKFHCSTVQMVDISCIITFPMRQLL